MEAAIAPTVEPVTVAAILVGLGVGSHVLANRLGIPSVTVQVLSGVLVGPEVLGVVRPETLQPALAPVVGVAVAVIVFDGAFEIDFGRFRRESEAVLRFVTVGALVAFLGTAALVRFALGVSWPVSALVAALLVATGPTVVTPILDAVRVSERLRHALEVEGVTNDVTAAILAVVAFELVTLEGATLAVIVQSFAVRLVVGIVVGGLVAAVLWTLFTQASHSPSSAPMDAGLLVFAGAVVAYGVGEAFVAESGIAAAAVGGAILGEVNLRYAESVSAFRAATARLSLGVIFVLLATLIRFSDILLLGIGGLVVVLGVALVVRPLVVAVSTMGSDFSWQERVFATLVAPRGIVPASVATLFALELQSSHPRAATVLAGTVFLVVLATIVVEGSWAHVLADRLDLVPGGVVIVGGGLVGQALARRYRDTDEHVTLIEASPADAEAARERGYTAYVGDGTDRSVLRAAGVDTAGLLVAATNDDDANCDIVRLAREEFGVERVLARVNDSANEATFDDLGVRTFPAEMAALWAIDMLLHWTATPGWLDALVTSGNVDEFEVGEETAGRTVGAVQRALPDRCFLVAATRDGETVLPEATRALEAGDRVTLLGNRDAVATAVEARREAA